MESLIRNLLTNMKEDALRLPANPSDEAYKKLIKKYDVIFDGEKFNKVLSFELAASLKITSEEFNTYIITVAKELNMGLEALHQVNSDSPNSIDEYYITLF